MHRKLVAITANTSWYLYNFRSNLIKALLAEGYRVLAVAPLDDYSKRLEALGDDIEFHPVNIDQGGTNPLKDLKTASSFYQIYKLTCPDIVLNFTPKNNIYSTLSASRLQIPIINNIAGLGSVFIDEGIVARIARWLYRVSQKHASHIFFQNEEDRDLFLQAEFVNPAKTERLPGSGVDLTRFQFTPLPSHGAIRFLLVARLLYEKGIKEYFLAAKALKAKYPHIECRLVGFLEMQNPSAIPRDVIEGWHNAGYINYRGATDKVEREIADVHCIILPSYYREGVPRSLLEGAAMGRPIITTNNVGCRETVNDGISGYLCQPRDQTSLEAAMEAMIHLSNLQRQNMAIASRNWVEEKFDESIVVQQYLQQIKLLTQRN